MCTEQTEHWTGRPVNAERDWRRRPESNRGGRICNPSPLIDSESIACKPPAFVHDEQSRGYEASVNGAGRPDDLSKTENAVPAGTRNGAEKMRLEKTVSRGYASDAPDAIVKTFAARRGQLLEAAASDTTLTPTALRVLMLLSLRWADAKTGRCWPAKATIAEALTTHEKTIQKALRELRERGWIMVVPGAGQNGTNVYQVVHSRFEGGAKRLQKGERNHSPNLTIEPNKTTTVSLTERVTVENANSEDERRTDASQHSRSVKTAKPIAENEGERVAKGGAPSGPSSRPIAGDGHEWAEWRAWLSESCIDPGKIPRCTMRDGSRGYLLPMRWPPSDRDGGRLVQQWMRAKGIHPTLMAA